MADTIEEVRLSKLESELSHVAMTVSQLSNVIEDGFKETRKIIGEQSQQFDHRVSVLHQRLDEHTQESLESRVLNPSLIVAIILAVIAVGGVGVAFVNMSITPVKERHQNDVEWMKRLNDLRYEYGRELHDRDMRDAVKHVDEVRKENKRRPE